MPISAAKHLSKTKILTDLESLEVQNIFLRVCLTKYNSQTLLNNFATKF
jgi:hypothetical protein